MSANNYDPWTGGKLMEKTKQMTGILCGIYWCSLGSAVTLEEGGG